ncbi:uncharacterized protein LOC113749804 [Coffea eugenioides]|uniref:uncharacterized protein LOC113749804 n=1 Tax=Coffea eugenioides TaxID=49369 RepID=UPI000F5D444E|nr:uncharacterized protein LOC113717361 [Coffea arabica]XP_027116765.1 uncharacterized protein LOC113734416 isoform X2 [Coffea arabica]XP_027149472.1 uncharacterized protein LOC113749804 [Coffea eugenioides]
MGSVLFSNPTLIMAELKYVGHYKIGNSGSLNLYFKPKFHHKHELRLSRFPSLLSPSNTQYNIEGDPEEDSVQHLRVPSSWLDPSQALEESEWLRVTLHKWLDDEYCPEETNIKISEELGSISYQESFHGAFSSANAAVDLIIQRIQQD